MADKRIGAAYVEILTKGITKVQSDLEKIKNKLNNTAGAATGVGKATDTMTGKAAAGVPVFQKLGELLQNAAKMAAGSFLAGTAAITGFIAAADPAGFNRMKGTLAAISVQIGSIFLPLLDAVQKALDRVLVWFRSLSDEQKDNILKWVMIAGAVLAGVVAFGLVMKVIGLATTAMSIFGAVTGVATGGISILVGLIASLVAGFVAFGAAGGQTNGVLASIWAAIQPVWNALKGIVSTLIDALLPIVTSVFGALLSIFQSVMPIITGLLEILGTILKGLAPIFEVIGAVVSVFCQLFAGAFKVLAAVVQPILELINSLLKGIGEVIQFVWDILKPIVKLIQEACKLIAEAFDNAFGDAIRTVIEGVVWVLQKLWDIIKGIYNAVKSVINAAKDLMFSPIMAQVEEIKKMQAEADAAAAGGGTSDGSDFGGGGDWSDDKKGRHAGQALQKVEMSSITDLWKKAMQSTLETPEQRKLDEINRTQQKSHEEQQKQTKVLEDIRDKKDGGGAGGGMGW